MRELKSEILFIQKSTLHRGFFFIYFMALFKLSALELQSNHVKLWKTVGKWMLVKMSVV